MEKTLLIQMLVLSGIFSMVLAAIAISLKQKCNFAENQLDNCLKKATEQRSAHFEQILKSEGEYNELKEELEKVQKSYIQKTKDLSEANKSIQMMTNSLKAAQNELKAIQEGEYEKHEKKMEERRFKEDCLSFWTATLQNILSNERIMGNPELNPYELVDNALIQFKQRFKPK